MISCVANRLPKRDVIVHWTTAGALPDEKDQSALGLAGPVAGVHHGVFIVGGGANFPDRLPWQGGQKKYYDQLYVYKEDGKLEPLQQSFQLPFALGYSANVSTSEGIICAGGENEEGISKKVLLLQWKEQTSQVEIRYLPDLPIPLTNAMIAAKDHKIYLVGGETTQATSDRVFRLDLKQETKDWEELPAVPHPVSHGVLAVQNNGKDWCLYLAGGRKKNPDGISDFYASLFQFDLRSERWQEKRALPYALSAGTGLATVQGSILLFGGDRGETFHKVESLIAAIAKEKDEKIKAQLNEEKIKVQSTHPGFSREVLRYDARNDEWTTAGTIPYAVPVTTTAVPWKGGVLLPSGEIRAGVRTPQLLRGTWTE